MGPEGGRGEVQAGLMEVLCISKGDWRKGDPEGGGKGRSGRKTGGFVLLVGLFVGSVGHLNGASCVLSCIMWCMTSQVP